MSKQNEDPQYGIYNSKNIKLTPDAIQEILLKGGITEKINNIDLWQQAFVHKSYCKNNKKKLYGFEPTNMKDIDPATYMKHLYEGSNEVLEWLGDGVLQSVVACYLSRRYIGQDEGFLTKLRSKLVKTEALSKMAKFLDMSKYIIMSEHVEKACNGRTNAKILEESGEEWNFNEGCLSIPNVREDVSRCPKIKIEYQDEDFKTHIEEFEGLIARVIQHEYDHIEGVLFTDKVSSLKKRLLKGKLTNISKGKTNVDYRMRFPNSSKKRS